MLDTRIPPVVLWLLCAVGMSLGAPWLPSLAMADPLRLAIAGTLLLIGTAVMLAGVRAFRTARTTVNPLEPQAASALVTAGVYRYTRNPMYLGMALVLTAWAAYHAKPWLLIGVAVFVLYLQLFQIAPEERALIGRFGKAFEDYRRRVRMWI